MEKWEVKVDNEILIITDKEDELAQQDSKASGRSENLDMYREVLGAVNKIICNIKYAKGSQLALIKEISKKTECTVDFYSNFAGKRRSMRMYPKCEKLHITEIDGTEYAEDVQISFIQMNSDEV